MRASSLRWSQAAGWSQPASFADADVQLLLAFGPASAPPDNWFDEVRARWANARVIYSSGGGQIDRGEVLDDAVVLTALSFDNVPIRVVSRSGAGVVPCEELGHCVGSELADTPDLRHVLLFVDGLNVNGAAFTAGLTKALPAHVTASGGLASDGTSFVTTPIGLDGPPQERQVVAVALSGNNVVVGTGSAGGWLPFGPERYVTKADGPTVYEIDGEPALGVYKRYLGELVSELPGSALLFPIAVTSPHNDSVVVRTILGIDESMGWLRFAGDVPQGHKVRLMRSTNDKLLDGAAQAAKAATDAMGTTAPGVLLCVSCIGRRAVLKSRVEEEVEEVTELAGSAVVSGYYSNGEIAPASSGGAALLHNQTMTITAIGER